MVAPQQSGASSDAVIQNLKWVRRQGFRPVPLRKQSKASIDEHYTALDYKPPADDLWLQRDLGLGVVTGPKHNGPVDIDLDCEEAVFFAKTFLPHTSAIFGRASKLDSHYLYMAEAEEFPKRAFIDPMTRSTIIEMRGDGHQTVFPGSIHETTGEIVQWSGVAFPEVPRVDVAVLELAVKKVAIATLITRHMWAEGQRNEVCKSLAGIFYYLDWTEADTKSLITAVMEYTNDKDRTRLRTVEGTYKKGERGGKITGSNTLKELLGDGRLVDRIMDWAGSGVAAILQDYNERFAVVAVEGKFRIAETIGIERGQPPVLYGKEDFLNLMATDIITLDEKPISRAKVWLSNSRRRSYRAMDFIPGAEDAAPVLNLWSGWALDPSGEKRCGAWLDLLYYTICGGDDTTYNWMLHWFANIVREPQVKPMTAPVLIGAQGAGKSLLVNYFGKILGPAYVTVTNEEHVYGRFNRHLATCLLLHSEEALYGGDRKHRGIIKSLITDEHRVYEPKNIDAKMIKNYLRLVLTSNEMHAAPTEADDRRFTIIHMKDRKINEKTIDAVLEEFKSDGPAGLFSYLLDMPYDPKLPKVNVKNDSLLVLKQMNFDPMMGWWYEVLKSGQMLPDFLAWAQTPLKSEWPSVVASKALYLAMVLSLRERGQRYIPDPTTFGSFINKVTGNPPREQKYFLNPLSDLAPREVRSMSSKQYSMKGLPGLGDCRALFQRVVGQEIDWPKEAAADEVPLHVEY